MTETPAAWLWRPAIQAPALRLTRDTAGEVHFTYDATGLYEILVGGVNLVRACYVIGSCGGPDDPGENVVSVGSNGNTLKAPGACPGSAFTFQCRRIDGRTLQLDVAVGPLAAPHQFMSVPMDCWKERVQTFTFAAPGYIVGCGNTWTARSGTGGPFASIPTPCVIPIPAPNLVGVARPDRLEPYLHVEAPGLATIRRTRAGGNVVEGTHTNHPHTNCLDWSWVRGWPGDRRLPVGATLTLRDQITVTPAGATPLPPAPTFTTALNVAALTSTAVTMAWATSPATTAVLKGWRAGDEGGAVTDPTAMSPWRYTALAPQTAYVIQVTVRDQAGRTAMQTVSFTTPSATTPDPPTPGAPMQIRIDVPAQSVTLDPSKVTELSLRLTVTPVVGPTPGPGPDPTPIPPGTARAPCPLGVSNVATMDALEAEAVLSAGCTLVQAEGIPFGAEKPGGQGAAAWDLARLVGIARVVQKYPDSLFFLTVVNANGARQMAQDTTWFRARVQEVLDHIRPLLGARLWLEGVSEPGDSGKSDEWCRVTRDMVSGTGVTLVGNGPGGRGNPRYGGIVDHHYCDPNDMRASVNAKRDRIHSTDCTPCLASNLSETFIRAVTREAMAGRQRVIWYDTDNVPALNRDVLRWVSEEIQAAFTPPPTGDPYARWPDTGIATDAQIQGIYRELLGRDADLGGLAFYRGHQKPPSHTWYRIRSGHDSPEYANGHPGAPVVTPPPSWSGAVPPPEPGGLADAIDLAQVEWIRPWESDAEMFRKTVRLTGVSADMQRISFNTNGGLAGWPNGTVDNAPANFLSFVKIDGTWYGGTWEWMGAGTGERRMDHNLAWHISGGDGPGNDLEQRVRSHPVARGDEVAVMVASCCRKPGDRPLQPGQRSNVVLVRLA